MYIIKSYFYEDGSITFTVEKNDVIKHENHEFVHEGGFDYYLDEYSKKTDAQRHANELFADGGKQENEFRF